MYSAQQNSQSLTKKSHLFSTPLHLTHSFSWFSQTSNCTIIADVGPDMSE